MLVSPPRFTVRTLFGAPVGAAPGQQCDAELYQGGDARAFALGASAGSGARELPPEYGAVVRYDYVADARDGDLDTLYFPIGID